MFPSGLQFTLSPVYWLPVGSANGSPSRISDLGKRKRSRYFLHLLFLFFGFFASLHTPVSQGPSLRSTVVLQLFLLWMEFCPLTLPPQPLALGCSSARVETPSSDSLLCQTLPTCRHFPNSVCHSWALTTLGLSTPLCVKPRPLSTLRIRADFHPQPGPLCRPSLWSLQLPDPLEGIGTRKLDKFKELFTSQGHC